MFRGRPSNWPRGSTSAWWQPNGTGCRDTRTPVGLGIASLLLVFALVLVRAGATWLGANCGRESSRHGERVRVMTTGALSTAAAGANRSLLHMIRNPSRFGVFVAALLSFIPLVWPFSLYVLLRYLAGRRARGSARRLAAEGGNGLSLRASPVEADRLSAAEVHAPQADPVHAAPGESGSGLTTAATLSLPSRGAVGSAGDRSACPECGESTRTGARMCRHCHFEFPDAPAPAEGAAISNVPVASAMERSARPGSSTSRQSTIGRTIVILAGLGLVIATAIAIMQPKFSSYGADLSLGYRFLNPGSYQCAVSACAGVEVVARSGCQRLNIAVAFLDSAGREVEVVERSLYYLEPDKPRATDFGANSPAAKSFRLKAMYCDL